MMKATYILLPLIMSWFINSGSASAQVLETRIESILQNMTIEEKIKQLHGYNLMKTSDNTRLDIPGFYYSDGPHGVRDADAASYPADWDKLATSFPVSIAIASTWDTCLARRMAIVMSKEFRAKLHNHQLGPSLYLCNDPRNGRSAESYGEDPYLCALMGVATVKGIQSTGLIANIKSYICENAQATRFTDDITINRRMLMEHWGMPFRYAIQYANALSIMSAYVAVNGHKASHSSELNQEILRQYWGYPYYMVSDWGSAFETIPSITSGCDIAMGNWGYRDELPWLVQNGIISETLIDRAVRNVLRTKIISGLIDYYPCGSLANLNSFEVQQLNYEAALKSLILLKNDNNILPLNDKTASSVALIGPSANVAQLDGIGSSFVFPYYSVSPKQGIEAKLGAWRVNYSKGCDINSADTSGFADALTKAAISEYVIFVGGLDLTQEGEGLDRLNESVELPQIQQILINRLSQVNPNVIVVLKSGGICSVSESIHNIKGLLYAFYPGQEGGNAIADVLFGYYNPGGKLPVSMPCGDDQLPERNANFNDDWGGGYRWMDKQNLTPLFPFGYGLSYTSFNISNLEIQNSDISSGSPLHFSVDISNTGTMKGEEVLQAYISYNGALPDMPVKQLKSFQRVTVMPGQQKTISFSIKPEEFYVYDETINSYVIPEGSYSLYVGNSSASLNLNAVLNVSNITTLPDLEISDILSVPAFVQQGDTVFFTANVLNKGNASTDENTQVEISFFVNGEFVQGSEHFTGLIKPGGMAQISASSGYWIASVPGTYSVEAIVNPTLIISETNTDNNSTLKQLIVNPRNTEIAEKNLAWRKPVSASSTQSGYNTFDVNDGYLTSRWASELFLDNQWICIDLQDYYMIDEITIRWEEAYAKEYNVLLSNDYKNWDTVARIQFSNGEIDKIPIFSHGKYIKIDCISRGTPWGFSIYEIEATGLLATNMANNSLVAEYIRLYPNPAKDNIYIELFSEGTSSISLQDITGRILLRKDLNHSFAGKRIITLPLQSMNICSGLYLIVLSNSNGTVVQKVLIK